MTCGARETAVARDEGRIERLGERDIDSIVSGQVGPQLPYARQKDVMGMAPEQEALEVLERPPRPLCACNSPANA